MLLMYWDFFGWNCSTVSSSPQNKDFTKHISLQCGVLVGRETETCSQRSNWSGESGGCEPELMMFIPWIWK